MIDTGENFVSFPTEEAALAFITEMDKQLGYPNAASKTSTCTTPIPSDDKTQWLVRLHTGIYSHADKAYKPLEPIADKVITEAAKTAPKDKDGKPILPMTKVTFASIDARKFEGSASAATEITKP